MIVACIAVRLLISTLPALSLSCETERDGVVWILAPHAPPSTYADRARLTGPWMRHRPVFCAGVRQKLFGDGPEVFVASACETFGGETL